MAAENSKQLKHSIRFWTNKKLDIKAWWILINLWIRLDHESDRILVLRSYGMLNVMVESEHSTLHFWVMVGLFRYLILTKIGSLP